MNSIILSEGHKDVTWVLVRKVFLDGSRLKEDYNTALSQTLTVQVIVDTTDFPIQEKYYKKRLPFNL